MSSSISHIVRYDANVPAGTTTHTRSERKIAGSAASALPTDGIIPARRDDFDTEITDVETHAAQEPGDDAETDESATDDAAPDGDAQHADPAAGNDESNAAADPAHPKRRRKSTGHTGSESAGKKKDGMVQLFEEIHTIVRELDASGNDTGVRKQERKLAPLGTPVKANDQRIQQAKTRQIRADGGGKAIVDTRDEQQDEQAQL